MCMFLYTCIAKYAKNVGMYLMRWVSIALIETVTGALIERTHRQLNNVVKHRFIGG